MMSYNDEELMRRFQALRGTTPTSCSQVTSSSSTPVLTHEQQQQHENETLIPFPRVPIDLPWNRRQDHEQSIDNLQTMEQIEENPAQEICPSVTQTKTDNESLFKDIHLDLNQIPPYLTKRNQSWQQMLNEILVTMKINDKNKIKDVRKIVLLIYKLKFIQIYQHLWTYYLKAGVGQLDLPRSKSTLNYPTNRPLWPKEIKTMVHAKMKLNQENEYESCFYFVQHYLQLFEDQLKTYQAELTIKVSQFGDNDSLRIQQQQMETYIEQHMRCLRKEIEHQIELIHYDYHIQVLKLEYFRYQPTEAQKQLMKKLCHEKYEQERTEQEYHWLQQQMTYSSSPNQSFEYSSLAHSSLIDSIADPILRQQLFRAYQDVAKQSRTKLFQLYLTTAQDERMQCKHTYDTTVKQMWFDRQTSKTSEQLPSVLIDLLNERCHQISQRIQCIYQFKTHSIGSNSE